MPQRRPNETIDEYSMRVISYGLQPRSIGLQPQVGFFSSTSSSPFVQPGSNIIPEILSWDDTSDEGEIIEIERAFSLRESMEPPKEKKDPNFRNEEDGEIIKSRRTFGIEFEVNFNHKKVPQLVDLIGINYGIEHDGSVRNGLEVVSPVLQGAAGEKQIIKVAAALKKTGAETDDSCGLHVHMGAKDFFGMKGGEIMSLKQALTDCEKKGNKSAYYYIIHPSFIKTLKNSGLRTRQNMARNITEHRALDLFGIESLREMLNDTTIARIGHLFFTDSVPDTASKDNRFKFIIKAPEVIRNRFKYLVKSVNYDGDRIRLENHKGEPVHIRLYSENHFLINPIDSARMIVVKIPSTSDTIFAEKLKRVVAFYVAFDDVIASMLPLERRDNDYAKRVNQKISIEQLQSCSTVLDIFRAWTHSGADSDMENVRRDSRHASRYCGLNLHALLKHGTIEIRYHAGTIEPHKILHWTALNQAILDLAADQDNIRCSLSSLQKASQIVSLEQKTKLFFKKLKLRPDTENYLLGRIKEFQKDDEAILEDCIINDSIIRQTLH